MNKLNNIDTGGENYIQTNSSMLSKHIPEGPNKSL